MDRRLADRQHKWEWNLLLDDALYRRLEALNRGRLPLPPGPHTSRAAPRPEPPPQGGHRQSTSAIPAATAARHASAGGGGSVGASGVVRLQGALLPTAQVVENARGCYALMEIPLGQLWPAGEGLVAARIEHLQQAVPPTNSPADLQRLVSLLPANFVVLDLETCGLGGSPLFLVGLLRHTGTQFGVELLFARNYSEEAAVLATLGTRLEGLGGVVTFNGKSFDWPMVTDRWHRHLLHRETPLPELTHVDMLHHARRRWKRQLPDCKLQTLERYICRRSRTGDIPGHRIPAAYDHYVRTGEPAEMEGVLYHNAVDLVTLLDLTMRLAG